MCHFQTGPLEAALDVEPLVGLAAVENALVTSDVLGHVVQRLDDAQPELLALLVLRDGDVFNVSDQTHVVYELALDYDGARAHDRAGPVADDEDVVRVVSGVHEVVAGVEFGEGGFADGRENAERVEKTWQYR